MAHLHTGPMLCQGDNCPNFGRIRRIVEGATGTGITENIAQAYAEVARQYRPGDRIYLIGFSRGAYTARCVAGAIARCGLLKAEHHRYADEVIHLYRRRQNPEAAVPIPDDMIHPRGSVTVEFLGLFDTVASLGVPLWGWWFRALPHWENRGLSTDPTNICRHIYHAMAMDERRSQFFPTAFTHPTRGTTTLEQVWFRGAHADVGGGYEETGLSDIALGWMVEAAKRHGLEFTDEIAEGRRPDPLAFTHDELYRRPSWRLFGSWPRWHPAPGLPEPADPAPPGTLHTSVLTRMDMTQGKLGRADFRRLGVGEAAEVEVHAHREWYRSGIVLEPGYYRVEYTGGTWRTAEAKPCGPEGERREDLALLRRLFTVSLRRPDQPWTRLCMAVAHPRHWELREYGLGKLLRYLYWKDPDELLKQVAPVGQDMPAKGAEVCLRIEAEPGLAYFFANDLWHTSGNNSGSVRLKVERVEQPAADAPLWVLRDSGHWDRVPPQVAAPPRERVQILKHASSA